MLVGAIHTITKAPLSERTAPAYEQPDDNTSGALDQLGNLTEAAAHSRKAFAEERLKQLREQMNKPTSISTTARNRLNRPAPRPISRRWTAS
jgi:hypothetical protein